MYRFTNFNVLSTVIGLVFSLMAVTSHAASDCRTATPGAAQWQNVPMPPVQNFGYHTQPGMYAVEFVVQPQSAGLDTLVALSQGPQTNWRNLAAIVRFNTNNTLDVRDGNVYRSDRVFNYEGQRQYYIRMEVNVYAHTYSVFVRPGLYQDWATGGTQIAKDYAFRTEQQGVTALDNVVFEAEVGSMHACAEATKPMLGPIPGGPAQWQNAGLPSLGVSAAITFDVEPLTAGGDTLLAVTQGPQTNWANLPMIVRFNSNNTIDVRDGDVYRADTVMPYAPGQHYRVTITFHKGFYGNPNSYSVSVIPPGGDTPLYIAQNYRLRTGHEYISEVNNWVAEAEVGAIRVRYVDVDTY